jgi:hypothetical protein
MLLNGRTAMEGLTRGVEGFRGGLFIQRHEP